MKQMLVCNLLRPRGRINQKYTEWTGGRETVLESAQVEERRAWIQKRARVSPQVLSQHLTNREDRLAGNMMDSIWSLKRKRGWIQKKKKKKKSFREAQQVQGREKQNGGNLQCVSAHCGASSLYQLDNDAVNKPLIGAPAAVRMESKC